MRKEVDPLRTSRFEQKFAGTWLTFVRFKFLRRKMLRANEIPENAETRVNNAMCDYCTWISEILGGISVETRIREKEKKAPRVDPVVIVHGGAGRIPRYARKFMLDEVKLFAIRHIKQCDSEVKQFCRA